MLTCVDKSTKEYVSLYTDGTTCKRKYLLNCFDISEEMKIEIVVIYVQKFVHVEKLVVHQATTGFDQGQTRN